MADQDLAQRGEREDPFRFRFAGQPDDAAARKAPAGELRSEAADHVRHRRLPEDYLVSRRETAALEGQRAARPEDVSEPVLFLDIHVVPEFESRVIGKPREETLRKKTSAPGAGPASLGVGRVPDPPGPAEQIGR